MIAAIYLNFKLPSAYQTRLPMLIGGIVSAVILVVFAGISGWSLLPKVIGFFTKVGEMASLVLPLSG